MKTPKPTVEIGATGRYLPDNVVTNLDLEASLDTSDTWIRERTGIRERRIADDSILTSDLGANAARLAMERAQVEPGEVDLVVVSTATPDRWLPSTACGIPIRVRVPSASRVRGSTTRAGCRARAPTCSPTRRATARCATTSRE